MQKLILFSFIFGLILVSNVWSDESAELKAEKEKYTEAKEALKQLLAKMQSEYIQNFAKILDTGVDDLEKNTEELLKTEKNATKRHEAIKFATESFARLVKFVKEVEENLPNDS